LYAYMNKRKTKKMFKKGSELHLEPPWDWWAQTQGEISLLSKSPANPSALCLIQSGLWVRNDSSHPGILQAIGWLKNPLTSAQNQLGTHPASCPAQPHVCPFRTTGSAQRFMLFSAEFWHICSWKPNGIVLNYYRQYKIIIYMPIWYKLAKCDIDMDN
jgi:hypothetical protein